MDTSFFASRLGHADITDILLILARANLGPKTKPTYDSQKENPKVTKKNQDILSCFAYAAMKESMGGSLLRFDHVTLIL
jgi:hypothetical protein